MSSSRHKEKSKGKSSGTKEKGKTREKTKGKSTTTEKKEIPLEERSDEKLLDEYDRKQKRIIDQDNRIRTLKEELDRINEQIKSRSTEIIDNNDFSKKDQVEQLINLKKEKLKDLRKEMVDFLKLLHFWNLVYFELAKRARTAETEEDKKKISDAIINSQFIKDLLGDERMDIDEIDIKDSHLTERTEIEGSKKIRKASYRGLPVSMKQVNVPSFDDFKESVRKLNSITFPKMAKHFGVCKTEMSPITYLVVEWQDMNLNQLLHSQKFYVSDKKRFSILFEVLDALSFLLYENKIVHGNLKSTNILLDRNSNIKLSDFRVYSDKNVTSPYLAPELRGKTTDNPTTDDYAADLYSFGILIWELFHMRAPTANETITWTENDPKYANIQKLFDVLTIPDKADRIKKLISSKYIEVKDSGVSYLKLTDALTNIESEFLTPKNNLEHFVWDNAVKNEEIKETVEYLTFQLEFEKNFPIVWGADSDDKKRACVKEILGARSTNCIQKVSWQRFYKWFKNMIEDGKKLSKFVSKLEELYKSEMLSFHGFLSKDDAIRTLKKYNEGNQKKGKLYYLVRIDEDKSNEFSLMYIHDEMENPIEEIIKFPDNDDVDELVTRCNNKIRNLSKKHAKKKVTSAPGPGALIFAEKSGSGAYSTAGYNELF